MLIEGTPEQQVELFTALAEARKGFKEIRKDADGQEKGGKFKYAPLKNLVEATAQALAAQGLVILQPFSIDDCSPERQGIGRLTTILQHKAGGRLIDESVFFLAGNIKEVGGQSTYMARYAYQRLLVLDGEDDVDNHDTRGATRQAEKKPRTKEQDDKVIDLGGKLGFVGNDLYELCIKVTGVTPENAGFDETAKLIAHLAERLNQKGAAK